MRKQLSGVDDDEEIVPSEDTSNPWVYQNGKTENKTKPEPTSRKDTGKFENELEGHSE